MVVVLAVVVIGIVVIVVDISVISVVVGRPGKPHPRTKWYIDRQTGCKVMVIFCIFKMVVSRHLEFYRIGNSAIRSAFSENPSLHENFMQIGPAVFS